jgi:alcohol dehydrogenase (quinone), cytochrome c subunit
VFGGMSDVVEHSTQFMTDGDLTAIARYLKSLPAANTADVVRGYDDAVARALHDGDDRRRGAAVFIDNCAACHRTDGKGYAGVFPALAGNSAIATADPSSLVQIILKGGAVPATARAPAHFGMPPFAWRLTNQEVADVATFVRSSWGNAATPVTSADVSTLRERTGAAAFAGK